MIDGVRNRYFGGISRSARGLNEIAVIDCSAKCVRIRFLQFDKFMIFLFDHYGIVGTRMILMRIINREDDNSYSDNDDSEVQ